MFEIRLAILQNIKKAKIEAKDLDLDKPNELLVAIAIVVIVVGFLICAPECLPALLAVV